ncbi:MAG TPA: hypothetical protein PK280_09570 [Planctomycetota bacterium]|nr:hypothetical protein [Planctomycetota bacterium]
MRLRGWLTVASGLALGLLVAFQSSRLLQTARRDSARDAARGLSEALRCRLELSRIMLDLNSASMESALRELGRWPQRLESAAIFQGSGAHPGLRASSGEAAARAVSGGGLAEMEAVATEDLPIVRDLPGERFLAMTRMRVGQADLSLVMVLAPGGFRPEIESLWGSLSVCLMALAAAAMLLVWLGMGELLSARRRNPPAA